MSKWIGSVLLCAGLVIACGRGGHGGTAGSGIEGSKPFVSLSTAELTQLCEYVVDLLGPDRTIDCAGDTQIVIDRPDVAQCVAGFRLQQQGSSSCTATVDNVEDCSGDLGAATDAELCTKAPPPASCTPLFQCQPPVD